MKKLFPYRLFIVLALITLQTACNQQEQKAGDTKPAIAAVRVDTLKIYLHAKEMGVKAFTMVQPGYYDSALARYNNCLAYLNKALQDNNNKGIYLYATEIIEINQGTEAIYDSIHQPGNAISSAIECLKWAKLVQDNMLQIKLDMHVVAKLKDMAKATTNDTAKKGSLGREALQYAIAGGHVIDSLKTNDMDNLRYEDFHLTSKIYTALGNREQARIYDKKYRDTYFKIYNKQPEGK
jgi:tetratricopeptide (TPR) repeat protein